MDVLNNHFYIFFIKLQAMNYIFSNFSKSKGVACRTRKKSKIPTIQDQRSKIYLADSGSGSKKWQNRTILAVPIPIPVRFRRADVMQNCSDLYFLWRFKLRRKKVYWQKNSLDIIQRYILIVHIGMPKIALRFSGINLPWIVWKCQKLDKYVIFFYLNFMASHIPWRSNYKYEIKLSFYVYL